MNVATQICTLRQAEKFKKFGLQQISLLYHYQHPALSGDGWAVGTASDIFVFGLQAGGSKDANIFSAFNAAELGAILQKETRYCFYHEPSGMWSHQHAHDGEKLFTTQAQCYAARLIWRMGIEPLKWTAAFINNRLQKFLGE